MASSSKTHLLNDVYTLLNKRYKLEPQAGRFSVLEAVVYGICHEGTTREQADQVMSRFKDQFFDWNEVRVSALPEIEGVLVGLSDSQARARRIRKFLRQLFERTYGFNLDSLLRKPQKDAVKSLKEYEAFQSDYVLATVIQQALGGHAIPIDYALRRVLLRLEVADEATTDEALRNLLERAVPKNRGSEFFDLVQELAQDACVEVEPFCSRCELRKLCPTGKARLSPAPKMAKVKPVASKPAVGASPKKSASEKSATGKQHSGQSQANSTKKARSEKAEPAGSDKVVKSHPKTIKPVKEAKALAPKNPTPPVPAVSSKNTKSKASPAKEATSPGKKPPTENKQKGRGSKGKS